ncbi:MAG TPA: phosphotransferase [Anaeromyxobacter sp.]|nr:phosphotransferase [Anaeromyxobacter sp.]
MGAYPQGLAAIADRLFPGAVIVRAERLVPDAAEGRRPDEGGKALGYSEPLQVIVQERDGRTHALVFRMQNANEYGHDRRADRVEGAILAFDVFGQIPGHVRALDVGLVGDDGRLVSMRGAGEPYLVTDWAEGTLYAEDLRRVAREGAARPLDLARCEALAAWLAALHARRLDDPVAWRRAVRDLLGHGEGIFGIVDGYPADVPAAPPARLRAIEERCLAWRWRLRGRSGRLARTHGDFHPFNVVFAPGEGATRFTPLDASRGGKGDPADDLTAMAVNYVFFAADRRRAWAHGLGPLWRAFWARWLEATGDREALEVAPPFLAWRALVVASPRFYPDLPPAARDLLLRLAERALDAGRLDLDLPDALLAEGP